jgi:hypothetical protein
MGRLHKLNFAKDLKPVECDVMELMERNYVGRVLIVHVNLLFPIDLYLSSIIGDLGLSFFLFVDDHVEVIVPK